MANLLSRVESWLDKKLEETHSKEEIFEYYSSQGKKNDIFTCIGSLNELSLGNENTSSCSSEKPLRHLDIRF